MKFRRPATFGLIAGACLTTALLNCAIATSSTGSKEHPLMQASGSFDVTLAPQKADNPQAQSAELQRMSIDKKYYGPLQGTSTGEMLAAKNERNIGAYVAIERVNGSLAGRRGTFLIAHTVFMSGSVVGRWSVEIVPDSATEQLAGLSGTMKITISGDKHFYELEMLAP